MDVSNRVYVITGLCCRLNYGWAQWQIDSMDMTVTEPNFSAKTFIDTKRNVCKFGSSKFN